MKTKQIVLVLFLCFGMFLTLPAQDFKEDFRRLQKNFLHLQNFYCEVNVKVYEQVSSAQPQQVLASTIKKQGGNYLSVTGTTTTLSNKNCNLQVNPIQKQLLYTHKSGKQEEKISDESWMAILDSAVKKKNDSVVFGGISGNIKKYTIYTSTDVIIRTEMYMDQKEQTITKLVYYYKPQKQMSMEKVVIEYEHMNLSPSFSDNEFSEKKYITYSGKTVKAADTFSTYKLIVTNPEELD